MCNQGLLGCFFFKQKTAYEIEYGLVGSEMCIRDRGQAVRQALPAGLPRVESHHEIEATHCACGEALKRIGEEVTEQLDCVPAQFFVLRHIRGKYACACCQTIQAAPMPAQIIDKGIPAPGLLAQVCLLYTSPSPRDRTRSRMPSSA